jgi:hypothetical protein
LAPVPRKYEAVLEHRAKKMGTGFSQQTMRFPKPRA